MGNVRSRGSRPVSPVTRGDEWASRGRWEKEPEYDERDEEFGDGRERIQSWQDGIHVSRWVESSAKPHPLKQRDPEH